MHYYDSANFKIFFAQNCPIKAFTKPALAAWGSYYKKCKKSTLELKNWGKNDFKKDTRKLKECYILKT